MEEPYSVVYATEAYATLLTAALDGPCTVATSRAEFLAAIDKRRPTVAYVDRDLLAQIEGATNGVPIIAISDGTVSAVVRSLQSFPWLSNLIGAAMLSTPLARANLAIVRERLERGPELHVPGSTAVGRVALFAHSARREARLERLRDFFATRDVSPKIVTAMSDVAEELVTNALYDAPAEAGYFKTPISRTADVELPPEHACEISYGIDGGSVFVRVRDPFGSLTRSRLLAVLDRCNHKDVSLDESRGGAGLGLWRVFSRASTIAIAVIPGRLTDVIVSVDNKRSVGKQLHAVQLLFPEEEELDGALGRFAADHDYDLIDDSFTAVRS